MSRELDTCSEEDLLEKLEDLGRADGTQTKYSPGVSMRKQQHIAIETLSRTKVGPQDPRARGITALGFHFPHCG